MDQGCRHVIFHPGYYQGLTVANAPALFLLRTHELPHPQFVHEKSISHVGFTDPLIMCQRHAMDVLNSQTCGILLCITILQPRLNPFVTHCVTSCLILCQTRKNRPFKRNWKNPNRSYTSLILPSQGLPCRMPGLRKKSNRSRRKKSHLLRRMPRLRTRCKRNRSNKSRLCRAMCRVQLR